jgi:DNA-binding protein HU-beta
MRFERNEKNREKSAIFSLRAYLVVDLLARVGRLLDTNTLKTMAKALTKSQIATSIAEKTGITKKTAGEVLEFIADLAYKNAKNSFTLPGLGKMVLVNRKARMGRNPATGQEIKIPAKKVVKFRVAKAAKDAILGAK